LLLLPLLCFGQKRAKWIPGTTPNDSLIVPSGVLVNPQGIKFSTATDVGNVWLHADTLFYLHDSATMTVTGSSIKTISVIKKDGSAWLSAPFTDNDNQNISLSSDDTLSISGGNKVWMPYEHKIVNGYISYTGVATNTFTLPAPIDLTKTYLVVYNTAALNRQDFTITYPVTLTTSFTTKTTDYIEVYYSVKQ
jgi:hypothetical protein